MGRCYSFIIKKCIRGRKHGRGIRKEKGKRDRKKKGMRMINEQR